MKVWELSCDSSNYEQLWFKNKEKDYPLYAKAFKGKPILEEWYPMELITDYEGKRGDVMSFGGSHPILTSKAVDILLDLMKDTVELLPIKHEAVEYYAMNVVNVLDCIDYEKVVQNRFGGFIKYAFIENVVRNQHIFKMFCKVNPVRPGKSYVDPVICVTDKFIQRIKENNLEGFYIKLVWDSEQEDIKKEITKINNDILRTTLNEDFEKHIQKYYGPITKFFKSESNMVHEHCDLYHIAPNEKTQYNTIVTFGYSFMRMILPLGGSYGYAELAIHLPKEWKVFDENSEWIRNLFKNFRSYILPQNAIWLWQWFVYPNQKLNDLRKSYDSILNIDEFDPNAEIIPYEENTEYCGMVIVPPIPSAEGVLEMPFVRKGQPVEGEWPIYVHTIVPLYKEEILYFFKEGGDALQKKLLQNGVEEMFNLNRKNTCK